MMLIKLEFIDGPFKGKKLAVEFGVTKGRDLFPLNNSFMVDDKGLKHRYVISIEDYATENERLVLRYDSARIADAFYVDVTIS